MFLHVDHIIEHSVGFGNTQLIIIYFMQKSFSQKLFQFFVCRFNYFQNVKFLIAFFFWLILYRLYFVRVIHFSIKVEVVREGHKILWNHHLWFDCVYCSFVLWPSQNIWTLINPKIWYHQGRFATCFSKLFRLLVRKNCSSELLKNH